MAESELAYERRRYSAVAISHPAIRSYSDLRKLISRRLHESHALRPLEGWKIWRVEVVDRKSHYPATKIGARPVPGENGFAHDCYVAINLDLSTPLLLVASPYRLLLDRFVEDLVTALPAPRAEFIALRVGALFDLLARGHDRLKATRISVVTAGEPGVALVSLSGISPLQSGLWGDIRERVTPYGARVEVTWEEAPARLNADRIGNYFWFQLTEDAIRKVCATIGFLVDSDLTTEVALSPLRRTRGEEDLDE